MTKDHCTDLSYVSPSTSDSLALSSSWGESSFWFIAGLTVYGHRTSFLIHTHAVVAAVFARSARPYLAHLGNTWTRWAMSMQYCQLASQHSRSTVILPALASVRRLASSSPPFFTIIMSTNFSSRCNLQCYPHRPSFTTYRGYEANIDTSFPDPIISHLCFSHTGEICQVLRDDKLWPASYINKGVNCSEAFHHTMPFPTWLRVLQLITRFLLDLNFTIH